MDSLPQELLDCIVSLVCELEPHALPNLATVSRRWQNCIERRTFNHLYLESNRLPDLQARFSGPFAGHRAAALRSTICNIILPPCSDEEVHQRETEQDVQKNSRALAEQLRNIFDFLLVLQRERERIYSKVLPLSFTVWSVKAPTDDGTLQKQDPARFKIDANGYGSLPPYEYINCDEWYWTRRWRYSVLELLPNEIKDLPEIHCVTHFAVHNKYKWRQLRPGDWLRIAMKFQRIEDVDLCFQEYRANGKELRRRLRKDLADSLFELANSYPTSLQIVQIGRKFSETKDEAMPQLDYGNNVNRNEDMLSQALSSLAEKCPKLKICGLNIAVDIFWPPKSWANLKEIDVEFDPVAPNGEWYFTKIDDIDTPPPWPEIDEYEYSQQDWDEKQREGFLEFGTPYELGPPRSPSEAESRSERYEEAERKYRARPLSRNINPLLIAAAKAVRFMPSLEKFSLHSWTQLRAIPPLGSDDSEDDSYMEWERKFRVAFVPKGYSYHTFRDDDPMAEWYVGGKHAELAWMAQPEGKWKPDREVREEWAETLGDGAIVYYEAGGHPLRLRFDTLNVEEFRE